MVDEQVSPETLEVQYASTLAGLTSALSGKQYSSLVPFLSLLFTLRGKPFSLKNHYVFEPLFSNVVPRSTVWRTGRQVGKTLSVSARGLLFTVTIPFFRILYVTPLHDQILRISNDHIRPLIEGSPYRHYWFDTNQMGSVLRRELRNSSAIYFSYAFLSCERLRGFSNIGACLIDETQDMDPAHLPVISEVVSASEDFGVFQYTGTSKTKDGTLEWLWQRSSQAEWIMKCPSCSFYNIPAAEMNGGHLEKMLGPYRDDISEDSPGIVCARCQKPLRPRSGRWIHRYPERASDFTGYHIPQPIMPLHYSRPDKYKILLGKQQGIGNYTTAKFYNECLGEAYDISTKLVNMSDLKKAATLPANNLKLALKACPGYMHRVLAVDWGGGGEDGVSLTTLAVLGILPNGRIDVIYGKRLLTPHDHLAEAEECKQAFREFQCDLFVHDYTGAGDLRHTFMVHGGVPEERILPIAYVPSASAGVMNFKPATIQHPRNYWSVDKTRSLQLTCYSLKLGRIHTFAYDFVSPEQPGLLHDFLALVENKMSTARRSDVYTIQRDMRASDDFAQAVNIGCCALWHLTGSWPNFSELEASTGNSGRASNYAAYLDMADSESGPIDLLG